MALVIAQLCSILYYPAAATYNNRFTLTEDLCAVKNTDTNDEIYRSPYGAIFDLIETDSYIYFIEAGKIKKLNSNTLEINEIDTEHIVLEMERLNDNYIVFCSDKDIGVISGDGGTAFERSLYYLNSETEAIEYMITNISQYKILDNKLYYTDNHGEIHCVNNFKDIIIKNDNIFENDEFNNISSISVGAADIISIAENELGYKETGNNYTKYGEWYGINPGAWCAMFISWCANQAEIPTDIIPKFASCNTGISWFQGSGKIFKTGTAYGGTAYQPQKGDIIFFSSSYSMSNSNHAGIVTGSDNNNVYTIEGNSTDMVARRSYALSNATILGYGVPKYVTSSKPYTNTIISGQNFETAVYGAEAGSLVILALYNENNQLIEIQMKKYAGENCKFVSAKKYSKAKIMLWNDISTMTPISNAEIK